MPTAEVIQGDCVEVLRGMDAGAFDAVVTDPPYGLEFMGKAWDSFSDDPVARSWDTRGRTMNDVPKCDEATPGRRHGAKTNFTDNPRCRTCGRAINGRDTAKGFKVCGCPEPDYYAPSNKATKFQVFNERWAAAALRVLKPGGYMLAMGGTRTYHRLACAVEDAGFEVRDCLMWLYGQGFPKGKGCLKPAYEPILLCRKPGSRVLPLGIDECRIAGKVPQVTQGITRGADEGMAIYGGGHGVCRDRRLSNPSPAGRWPANVCHDGSDEVLAAFAAFGERPSGQLKAGHKQGGGEGWGYGDGTIRRDYGGDTGTAARFFYTAKASKRERGEGNNHPTVKPLALMQWLVRLVTHPGGRVLDPFGGSGTTAVAALREGRSAVLVEKEAAYVDIARRRIAEAQAETPLFAEVA